jgi:hypothetical protein
MGAIHFSIDVKLAGILQRSLEQTVFVETGTFKGETLSAIFDLYDQIYSCECSDELYCIAKDRFADYKHMHLLKGSSPELIAELPVDRDSDAVLYWLDAHWCAGEGENVKKSQCPLLEELDSIHRLNENSVVWIDDARYFLAPPPAPMDSSQWPTCFEVFERLGRLAPASHQYMVINDTILYFPKKIESLISDYARNNGADWLQIAHNNFVVIPKLQEAIQAYEGRSRRKRKWYG